MCNPKQVSGTAEEPGPACAKELNFPANKLFSQLYDVFPIEECNQRLWTMLKGAFAQDDADEWNSEERMDTIYFYEILKDIVDAGQEQAKAWELQMESRSRN